MVGTLSPDPEECKSYLIIIGLLDTTNANTIAQFFDESVNILGFRVLKKEDILLFVTDTASYMGYTVVKRLRLNKNLEYTKYR